MASAEFRIGENSNFTHHGNIFVGSQNFNAQNIDIGSTKNTGTDDYQCVLDLYSLDRDASIIKEKRRDDLVEESFAWIFENEYFRVWIREADQESERQKADLLNHEPAQAQEETPSLHTRHQILRITAGPGMGKTMTMIGIINELSKTKAPVMSYFLCQGADDRLNNPAAIIKGLLHQILSQPNNKNLIKYLREPYSKNGSKIFEGDSDNVFIVLQNVLLQVIADDHLPEVYFLVDALDECKGLRPLLRLIQKTISVSHKVRWLISNRNNIQIDTFFENPQLIINFKNYTTDIKEGISIYISRKVAALNQSNFDFKEKEQIYDVLLDKAQGTYLWINLACEALEEGSVTGIARLEKLPPGLTAIYDTALENLRGNKYVRRDLISPILRTVVVAFRPLQLEELAALIQYDSEEGASIMEATRRDLDMDLVKRQIHCNPFLAIQGDAVCFIHHSAKEYLEQNDTLFPVSLSGESESGAWLYHQEVYINCRRQLMEHLKFQTGPGVTVEPSTITQMDYACCNWANHVEKNLLKRWDNSTALSARRARFLEELMLFFKQDFLNWVIALGALGKLMEAVTQLDHLNIVLKGVVRGDINIYETLLPIISDAQLFISCNRPLLEDAPLQIYSAILFGPEKSAIKNIYSSSVPPWIKTKPITDQDWDRCICVERFPESPRLAALSRNNDRVAVSFLGGKVRVLDIISGALILGCKAEEYLGSFQNIVYDVYADGDAYSKGANPVEPESIAFSIDDKKVMATFQGISVTMGSQNHMAAAFCVFDMVSGVWETSRIIPLGIKRDYEHTHGTLQLTPSGQYCIGFYEKTIIYLRPEIDHGCPIYSFDEMSSGHPDYIQSLVFSLDSERFATISPAEVRIWRTQPLTRLHTINIDSLNKKPFPQLYPPLVRFSYDHQIVIIADRNQGRQKIEVLNLFTGERTSQKLSGHPVEISASQDGAVLACFSSSNADLSARSRENLKVSLHHFDRVQFRLQQVQNISGVKFHTPQLHSGWIFGLSTKGNRFIWFIWNFGTNDVISLVPPSHDGSEYCDHIEVSQDGLYVSHRAPTMSQDGTILATLSRKRLMVWNVRTYPSLPLPSAPLSPPSRPSLFSPLYSLARMRRKTINPFNPAISKIYGLANFRDQAGERGNISRVLLSGVKAHLLALLADGSKAATIMKREVYIWGTRDQLTQQIIRPGRTKAWVTSLAFGHDTQRARIACASYTDTIGDNDILIKNGYIDIYDISHESQSRKFASYELNEQPCEGIYITVMAFSPDDSIVAYSSISFVGHIYLTPCTGNPKATKPKAGTDYWIANAAVFSRNGRFVAFAGGTRYVMLYSIYAGKLNTLNRLDSYSIVPANPFFFCQDGGCLILGNRRILVKQQSCELELMDSKSTGRRLELKKPFEYKTLEFLRDWLYFGRHPILWIPELYRPDIRLFSKPNYCCSQNGVVVVIRPDGKVYSLKLDLEALAKELKVDWQPPKQDSCPFCQHDGS